MEVTMSRRDERTGGNYVNPIPDPDSLAMDDRGTRPYRSTGHHRGERRVPDDGNYIGDPNKPEEDIRADDDEGIEGEAPLPASDAPTIIRDAPL
jgi:hypothetical protein